MHLFSSAMRGIALAVASIACAASAAAQQVDAEPFFGVVQLESGFTPDPRVIVVHAGGPHNANTFNPGCLGYVTNNPAVRLEFEAGSLPLIISVAASEDTTLAILGPDGAWRCDDDGGVNGANPSVRYDSPQSGAYRIWVGHYRRNERARARLHVSELISQ